MKTKFLLAAFIALTLAMSIAPAYAQGVGVGRSVNLCFGGNATFEPTDRAVDFTLLGCNGTVKSGATVPGTAAVFGGNLTIEQGSTVAGDVAIFGGNATVAGEVKGDVAVMGGTVQLQPSAVVDGSMRIVGGTYNKADGAVVRGSVTHENNFRFSPTLGRVFAEPFSPFQGFASLGLGLFRGLITALALAVLGALVVVFFPKPVERVRAAAQSSIGPSLGVGCLTLVVAVVIFIPLFVTLIGPFLLAIGVAAAWIFGWIAIGYLAGDRILEALKVKEIAPVLAVVAGVLVLAIIGEVPCIGWLIGLLIGTAGVGAVVLTRFGTQPYPLPPGPTSMTPVPVTPMASPPATTA